MKQEHHMNKYLFGAALFLAGFIALAVFLALRKRRKKKTPLPLLLPCIAGLIVCGAGTAFFAFFSVYYKASPAAAKYLESSPEISVEMTDGCILFDGSGESGLLIFYPGAKVEYTAYAPLLYRIAEKGTDCCIVQMPFNFALLGINKADKVISEHSYSSYYLAGHSLGGVAASEYASMNAENVRGLVLLASFPVSQMNEDCGVLSVYGSCDKVLDKERFDEAEKYMPAGAQIVCIEGADHAGFGEYGSQKGDGQAEITPDEQKDRTAELISGFIARSSAAQ